MAHEWRRGAYADVLHEVWDVMHRFQGRVRGSDVVGRS